jgi:Cd(II)/Pb(II)-responsive transcriptional regulator
MRIGELAAKAETRPVTVRYYEGLGLLPRPGRTEGNYRVYDEGHLERLRFIRNCRAIGMTLEEVRRLLYFKDRPELACHEINQLLDRHIDHLRARLRGLHRLEEYLLELRACCDSPRTAGDCGILAGLNLVQ